MSRNAFDALVREENEMEDLKEIARMERRANMSNAKHTPGPYPLKAEQVSNDGQAKYLVVTNQGNHFATTYDPTAARLIAAAPELLAALSDLLAIEGIEGDRSVAINKAFATIAKARGE